MTAARPYRDLCPEADARDAMSDDEFWQHVADNLTEPYEPFDDEPEVVSIYAGPCSECGESGACAYDAEGRPLFHAAPADDDPSP